MLKSKLCLSGLSALVFVGVFSDAQAQQRSIVNQSFEEFTPGFTPPTSFIITSDDNSVGWMSSNGSVEIWASGFQGVPALDGTYFIELNPQVPVRTSQEVCIVQNEIITYSFGHRARADSDNPTQTVEFSAQGTGGNTFQQVFDSSTLPTPATNPEGSWVMIAGTTTFTGPTGIYDVGFQSTDPGSYGNFLDNITITPIALTEFDPSATQGFENETPAPLPRLLVSGVVREDTIVTLSIVGTTATVGDDFTIDSTTITIPAGTYDGSGAASQFMVPVTIINDNITELDEVIEFAIVSVTNASDGETSTTLQAGDIQCVGAPQVTATYTIRDAEPEIDVVTSNGDTAIADAGLDDLGARSVGVAQTVTYTITNTGNDDLILGTPVIDSGASNVSGASVGAPGQSTLAPGESTTITVTYTPTAAGPFDFAITVPNNDPDEGPYNIDLTGVAFDLPVGFATLTANPDSSTGNTIGTAVEVDVVANDTPATGRTLVPSTVALIDPATDLPVASLVVADQGTWTVNATTGAVTFTPLATFTGNPDPVSYVIDDDQGNTSAPATVTVTYTGAPIAVADESLDNTIGQPVAVAVLVNDSADTGRTLDPTSVALIDPDTGNPVTSIVIIGEGTWTVSTTGVVTFTPDPDFTGSPAPVSYTVDDDQGNTSAPATITVGYEPAVNIQTIEAILSDDLLQTTTMLSNNASRISSRAADRLDLGRGQACGDEINDLLRSNPIYFATDKFFIDARNNAVLDRIALILSECPGSRFMIAGHTDSRASDAYNLILSQNRVDAVKAALINRGIATERLETEGFGERRPIATNTTAEGMALNRRVEFMLLDGDALIARPCGQTDNTRRLLDGASDGETARLNGTYRADGYNCVTDDYHETWAELSVTHDDDRGTMGMLSFGMSRERQVDNRLFGRFIEGYLSKSEVDTADANGTITGVGVHAGLFGAHETEAGLIVSYYGSAAVGHHSFELQTIDVADGSYTYAGLFAGGAIGGAYEYHDMVLKPRVGIDFAYAAALGSEISVPDVELDIDPATYARAFVELGMERTLADGDMLQFAPRVFCAINGNAGSEDCGFGAMLRYETMADDSDVHWDITADYEQIGDRQTATLSAARSVSIFNGLGVSLSKFGASQTGAIEASQHVAFTW